MLQKALLGGFALLLVAAGVFAWLDFDTDPELTVPAAFVAGPVEAATAAASGLAPIPADASAARGSDERAAVTTAGEATQRPLPTDPRWVAVRIVDRATTAPVPGAIVHWFDETVQDYLNERHRGDANALAELRWHGERLAELAGWRTRADAEGIARVTLKESTTVLARHDAAYGRLHLQSTTVTPIGGHTLELAPDLALVVRAVDDRGSPCAGVPVTVALCDREGSLSGWSGMEPLARTRAPDGLATIPHLQELATGRFGPFGTPDANQQWRARVVLPGCSEPGVVVELAAPPTEPVDLRVPPCGSLRVRAEFAGKPVPGFDSAWLTASNDGNDWRPQATRTSFADADGQVRFVWVPVGVKYRVGASAIGGLHAEVAGPRHAGHEVEVVLAPPDDAMLLAGRLLLPNQLPLSEQKVQLRLTGALRSQAELRTDRDGRFLCTLGSPRKDNRVDQLWFEVVKKGELPLRAEAPPRTMRPGIDELGDLVLAGGTLVVAGRIVAGEQPFLDTVNLRVERFEAAATPVERPVGNFQAPEQREHFERLMNARNEQRAPRWRSAAGMLEHKDGAGGFTIRGPATPGRYRLVINSQKVLPVEPVEFALGATDVVVHVDPGSSLAASVLLPEQAPGEYVSAVLVPAVAPAKPERNNRLTQTLGHARAGRHDVQWLSVPPGRYTLEFRLLAVPNPLLAIADVVLPPPAGGDARLAGIDLRAMLRVVTVQARSADGQLLSEVNGAVFPAPPTIAEWLGYEYHMQNQRLLLPAGPYDLLVCLHGYRPQPVRGSGDVATVQLDRWPTVTVVVADVPELPANTRVQVSLQPAERSELKYRTQWSSGDRSELLAPSPRNVALASGRASVPIGDGLFTLRLQVSGNRRSHTIVGHEPPQVLSTVGEVTVVVPKEQWDKAIEAVKPQPAPRAGEARR